MNDPIAAALSGATKTAAILGIPDFTPILKNSSAIVAYCDACDEATHHFTELDAITAALDHIIDVEETQGEDASDDCDSASYLVQMVDGHQIATSLHDHL